MNSMVIFHSYVNVYQRVDFMTSYYTSDLCLIEQWTTDWHLRGKDGFFCVVRFHAIHHHWALGPNFGAPMFDPQRSPIPNLCQGIWLVFSLSLLGRSICLWYSHHAILHRRSGRLVTSRGCSGTWETT